MRKPHAILEDIGRLTAQCSAIGLVLTVPHMLILLILNTMLRKHVELDTLGIHLIICITLLVISATCFALAAKTRNR